MDEKQRLMEQKIEEWENFQKICAIPEGEDFAEAIDREAAEHLRDLQEKENEGPRQGRQAKSSLS